MQEYNHVAVGRKQKAAAYWNKFRTVKTVLQDWLRSKLWETSIIILERNKVRYQRMYEKEAISFIYEKRRHAEEKQSRTSDGKVTLQKLRESEISSSGEK